MENTQYFCYINGQQYGPMGINDLNAYNINRDTLVWREGWADWIPAGKAPELSGLFYNMPPVPPVRGVPATPKRKTFVITAKVFAIFGIIASSIMQIPSWVMLVGGRYTSYGYGGYYIYYGIDQEWGFYFLFLSLFLLAFSIVTLVSANITIRRNRAQR